MVAHFPIPRPDEFLYSLCAKYQEDVGARHIGHVDEALFRKPMRNYMFTFPHRIDNMVSELLVPTFKSAEDLIKNHTMLPFFLPFLGRERSGELIRGTRGDGVGKVALEMFGVGMRLTSCRYCPECAAEDRRTYKKAYWHRAHLLPGIPVCFRHKVYLEVPKWIIRNRGSERSYETAETCIPYDIEARAVDSNDPHQALLLWLAEQGAWMLTHRCAVFDREKLREYYRITIALEGHGRIESRTLGAFVHIAKDRIPSEWLRELGWPESGGARWVHDILFRCNGSTVQHLMVLWLLNRTMQDLTQDIGQELVFDKGPWPCLNPACESHAKDVIKCYRLGTDRGGNMHGSFRCVCGFTYRRNGPDRLGVTRPNPVRVLETGKLWQGRLVERWTDTTLSTRRLARSLGVPETRIFSEARRLGLPELEARRAYTFRPMDNTTQESIREKHRASILRAIASEEEVTRAKIHELHRAAFDWLRKNDPEWLDERLPLCKHHNGGHRGRRPVDWASRDTMLVARIAELRNAMIRLDGPPIRVSKERLLRELGVCLRGKPLSEKLPLLARAIEDAVESPLAFSFRKLAQLIRERPNMSRYKMIRAAAFLPHWLKIPSVVSAIELALASVCVEV